MSNRDITKKIFFEIDKRKQPIKIASQITSRLRTLPALVFTIFFSLRSNILKIGSYIGLALYIVNLAMILVGSLASHYNAKKQNSLSSALKSETANSSDNAVQALSVVLAIPPKALERLVDRKYDRNTLLHNLLMSEFIRNRGCTKALIVASSATDYSVKQLSYGRKISHNCIHRGLFLLIAFYSGEKLDRMSKVEAYSAILLIIITLGAMMIQHHYSSKANKISLVGARESFFYILAGELRKKWQDPNNAEFKEVEACYIKYCGPCRPTEILGDESDGVLEEIYIKLDLMRQITICSQARQEAIKAENARDMAMSEGANQLYTNTYPTILYKSYLLFLCNQDLKNFMNRPYMVKIFSIYIGLSLLSIWMVIYSVHMYRNVTPNALLAKKFPNYLKISLASQIDKPSEYHKQYMQNMMRGKSIEKHTSCSHDILEVHDKLSFTIQAKSALFLIKSHHEMDKKIFNTLIHPACILVGSLTVLADSIANLWTTTELRPDLLTIISTTVSIATLLVMMPIIIGYSYANHNIYLEQRANSVPHSWLKMITSDQQIPAIKRDQVIQQSCTWIILCKTIKGVYDIKKLKIDEGTYNNLSNSAKLKLHLQADEAYKIKDKYNSDTRNNSVATMFLVIVMFTYTIPRLKDVATSYIAITAITVAIVFLGAMARYLVNFSQNIQDKDNFQSKLDAEIESCATAHKPLNIIMPTIVHPISWSTHNANNFNSPTPGESIFI